MDIDFATAVLWGGVGAVVFGGISHLLKKRKQSDGTAKPGRPLDNEPQ